jgi:RNA polymerase sigma-70 factor (ECF subfamily)
MDGETIEQLYRRYFPLAREKCRRMLGGSAEAQDVAQETMVRLWRANRDGMALSPKQTSAWIYRTSTRLAVDALRRRARMVPASAVDDTPEEATSRPDVRYEQVEWLRRIARSVPERELEVAVLHRVDGLTLPELAEVIGAHERTARRLLAKLDARLERMVRLEAKGEERT